MLKSASKIVIFLLVFFVLFAGLAVGEERFGGVGLKVAQLFDPTTKTKAGELVILEVLAGADASAKSLIPGDIIIKIDQMTTKDADLVTLVNKLRGSAGSEVVLQVKRATMRELLTFTVKRSEIVDPK